MLYLYIIFCFGTVLFSLDEGDFLSVTYVHTVQGTGTVPSAYLNQ
jgi:hypothetical protein